MVRSEVARVHAALTLAARRTTPPREVSRLLKESKAAISERLALIVSSGTSDESAALRLASGRIVELTRHGGEYRMASAGLGLPLAYQSPVAAASALGTALSARDFAGLLAVLSRESATSLQSQLSGLASDLQEPRTLRVELQGERATVWTASGHRVELVFEEGAWKVYDFE